MSSAHHIPVFGQIVAGVHYTERPGVYALLSGDNPDELAVIRTPMGLFLPGGGLEVGEDPLIGLARELDEEIGYQLIWAELCGQAIQYHWSEHYQTHFKKIGQFYRADAVAPATPRFQAGHELLWLARSEAQLKLSQEFQRFAVANF